MSVSLNKSEKSGLFFIIKKTIRYAYGPKKLSEMVRKKPPMI